MSENVSTDPERLIDLARHGSGEALGQLLELYRNYLTLLSRLQMRRRLQSKVDTADLIQETFLEAHRDFTQFRGDTEAELIRWLRQILIRNLVNLVRRFVGTKRRDVRLERQLAVEMDQSSNLLDRGLAAPGTTPSQSAARREQSVLLANALERLPDDYREVMILRHLEGLTFPEIAQRMERTVDSVEKLWTRALVRLRRMLGEPP
jgi:RNA polymerase sigma-70 factor (ECF subfamily)